MSDSKAMSDSGCTSAAQAPPGEARPDSPVADRVYPSPNHGERKGGAPDSIILHYTGMTSASDALLWLANPLSQVSCHYFVFEDGRVWQMVPENRRAWHAGKSSWHGETDMNSRSIGIEIVNAGHDLSMGSASDADTGSREADPSRKKYPGPFPPVGPDFPDAQIDAVIALVKDIAARWSIPPQRILAHSDIAPGRKIDPGEGFPWKKLAAAGVGLWASSLDHRHSPSLGTGILTEYPMPGDDKGSVGPSYRLGDEGMPVAALQSTFARFGYGLDITGVYDQRTFDVVAAFQRHWRQGRVDGVADGETVRTLRALHSAATLYPAGS